MSDKTTNQAKKGTNYPVSLDPMPPKDMNRNPTGKGGFGDHPENRSDGGWKKEMVFSYQYRRFMNMTMDELNEWRALPDMKRTVVEELAYQRVMAAKNSLPDVKEITDRTEGKAPQFIGLGGEEEYQNKIALVQFMEPIDGTGDDTSSDTA